MVTLKKCNLGYEKKKKDKREITKKVERIETNNLDNFLAKQKTKGLKKVLKDNKETNRALKLCSLQPLYAKYRRDFVIMVAINEEKKTVEDVDRILEENNLATLDPCSRIDS